MTITAIMQPYLFSYLGYWQMAGAADIFVLLDDVNFIKKGWINRNNILLDGRAHMFTLPLSGVSQNKLICEIEVSADYKEKQKLLKTIGQCYAKAPYFNDFFPVVEAVINHHENNLASFLEHHFILMFEYLGCATRLLRSSGLKKNNEFKAQDRIIDICRRLDTKVYLNAIGGQELYQEESFHAENMALKFIKMRPIPYRQFSGNFVPGLSIIDVLMFNGRSQLKNLLNEYDLI